MHPLFAAARPFFDFDSDGVITLADWVLLLTFLSLVGGFIFGLRRLVKRAMKDVVLDEVAPMHAELRQGQEELRRRVETNNGKTIGEAVEAQSAYLHELTRAFDRHTLDDARRFAEVLEALRLSSARDVLVKTALEKNRPID